MKFFSKQNPDAPRLKVYLAGPDVFFPNRFEAGKIKKAALAEAGLQGLYPMDPELKDFGYNPTTAYKIAAANEGLMDEAQIIFVNMRPWHGPSMDAGTAFEVGYMSGKAKFNPNEVLIIGYYEGEVEQDFTQRVINTLYKKEDITTHPNGEMSDKDGNFLEQFGLCENLMIPGAIKKTGGAIFPTFKDAVANVQRLWDEKQAAIENVATATPC